MEYTTNFRMISGYRVMQAMNTDKGSNNSVEQQALATGIAINLVMALAGWLAYYLSRSQALLLDGNFSFLMFVSLFVAMKISAIKAKRTALFPYGQFVYEALYSLLKGIMICGVLLVTLIQNTAAILHFLGGGQTHTLNTTVIADRPVLEMERTSSTSGRAYITASMG